VIVGMRAVRNADIAGDGRLIGIVVQGGEEVTVHVLRVAAVGEALLALVPGDAGPALGTGFPHGGTVLLGYVDALWRVELGDETLVHDLATVAQEC
jgi:hypothetical protein